mmetsp:Transcript_43786/g.107499  ORF Transcript_43786/g.107499 Transcript_43786/m.107499 type:complete len:540 (-) Transcript_43786:91-1710(-)
MDLLKSRAALTALGVVGVVVVLNALAPSVGRAAALAAVVLAVARLAIPAHRRYYPGEFQWGYFGTLPSTVANIRRRHRYLADLYKQYGGTVQTTRFSRLAFLLTRPNDIKWLMTHKALQNRPRPSGFEVAIPQSLLGLPTNDEWRGHRRLISPLFAERFMKAYADVIMDEIDNKLVAKWRRLCAGGGDGSAATVEVHADLTRITFDIIGRAGFATNFNSFIADTDAKAAAAAAADSEKEKYLSASEVILNEIISLTLKPQWLQSKAPLRNAIGVFLGAVREVRRADAAVDHHDEDTASAAAATAGDGDAYVGKPQSMLHALLQAERRGDIGAAAVDEETIALLLAGHETTANTTAWALYLLATHADVQRKMVESIRMVVGDNERLCYHHIKQLEYVKWVFYEALRMFPTVVIVARQAAEPVKFRDRDFPKGTVFMVNIVGCGLNKDQWGDDVDVFRPERHASAEPTAATRSPFALLSFGAGPRTCIGKRFALEEGVLLLASIVRSFELSYPSHRAAPAEVIDVTLGPKKGLHIDMRARA